VHRTHLRAHPHTSHNRLQVLYHWWQFVSVHAQQLRHSRAIYLARSVERLCAAGTPVRQRVKTDGGNASRVIAEQHVFGRALRAEPNRAGIPTASKGFDAANSRRRRCYASHPETPPNRESFGHKRFPIPANMFRPTVGPPQRPHRGAHWSTAITRRRDRSTSSHMPLSSRATVNAPG
jgi:hypothetical protein